MVWAALLVALACCAFTTWGWASERRINATLTAALGIEKEAYRQLVAVFNAKTVGASLKHQTVDFAKEHIREQGRHTTQRLPPADTGTRKRTPRH